ncbi:MAG: hypothetical protein KBT04_04075 [Bacteroidales bacterium]|nr:hypothetical protein [Candidatus Colimorpha onthohippi]
MTSLGPVRRPVRRPVRPQAGQAGQAGRLGYVCYRTFSPFSGLINKNDSRNRMVAAVVLDYEIIH